MRCCIWLSFHTSDNSSNDNVSDLYCLTPPGGLVEAGQLLMGGEQCDEGPLRAEPLLQTVKCAPETSPAVAHKQPGMQMC